MGWLPLSFGYPLALIGLLALPVIWWLLRMTPPKPQEEIFPPLRILSTLLRREETPHQSPWWLTLLRLLMAALVIFALAQPVMNARENTPVTTSTLAIVLDNSWATAPDWDFRKATAERLIADAGNVPIILALTADLPNSDIGPFDATMARERLAAAEPRSVPTNRPEIFARVRHVLSERPDTTIAILTDGLSAPDDETAFANLLSNQAGNIIWIEPDIFSRIGIKSADNHADSFVFSAIRAASNTPARQVNAYAMDDRGRRIAETTFSFAANETEAEGQFRLPFELRNDFTSIMLDGEPHAAATYLLDENSKRRRVGLISQAEANSAQPLLSPLYYIRRAMEPFADIVEPQSSDLADAITQILEQRPAMIVMADVGVIPQNVRENLIEWLRNGGTLVRFAGARLAAAGNDDELLPVRLRTGERALGGAMSWTEPQAINEFPPNSPFADLAPPRDVTVSRQVLAEPTADIAERTWASLSDGTPLVTAASQGDGTLVLFHTAPEATWSNLPISGSFVEMLRRIVQISRNQGQIDTTGMPAEALPPYSMINADGRLVVPGPEMRPLEARSNTPITIENPPGFYGSEEGLLARNLLVKDASFIALAKPQTTLPIRDAHYAFDQSIDLKGFLLALAIVLLILDTLAVFWLGGAFSRMKQMRNTFTTLAMAIALGGVVLLVSQPAIAQPPAIDDAAAVEAISKTRIAYVITGDDAIDDISKAGLQTLSRYITSRTAMEPGEPAGVDIETDELAFYPLLYWAIDDGAAMPSTAALARVDAYMREGGTVLFDTRDQFSNGLDGASTSPSTLRLRAILANMNVPPLEPVPADHVLTKTFYITPDFPGRYNGSPLWVEATVDATNIDDRPVRTGDGVTPIMITANDLAGAWAMDASGAPLFPTIPADPMQRVYAFRAGVNIMMYMLTGNYKSDQVHVPALLERLGQ